MALSSVPLTSTFRDVYLLLAAILRDYFTVYFLDGTILPAHPIESELASPDPPYYTRHGNYGSFRPGIISPQPIIGYEMSNNNLDLSQLPTDLETDLEFLTGEENLSDVSEGLPVVYDEDDTDRVPELM
ncbi:hypothetical protein B0H14DRAFT_2566282 [Mycena olivaceomarginata]|nr:hypothetical protein B0H14DRAFT_2566282 [Mycena olivaceomarginata]